MIISESSSKSYQEQECEGDKTSNVTKCNIKGSETQEGYICQRYLAVSFAEYT